MGTRTGYSDGIFCWVDLMTSDAEAAKSFYGELLGWSFEDMPTDIGSVYSMASFKDAHAAAIFSQPEELKAQGIPPFWQSYISVDDLNATLEKVADHGGTIFVPAMDVMDSGKMATILDPAGAVINLWEPKAHFGAAIVNEPHTWIWTELISSDVEASKTFFANVFGWTYERHDDGGEYWVIQHEGSHRGGIMPLTDDFPEGVPSHWAVYFNVPDLTKSLEKVVGMGGAIVKEPFDTPWGKIAVVFDAQHAPFCLIQCEQWDD